jgi:hypothetical protein
VPGDNEAGKLGEWPLTQRPPECGGVEYQVVEVGKAEGGMSNLYFVPVESVEALLGASGGGS